MSTSRTQTSKPQQPSFFGCCGVLMNPFAYGSRQTCSRRYCELKNLVGGTPCRHGVVVSHRSGFIGITGMAVLPVKSRLCQTRLVRQRVNSAYADNVLIDCRSALVWTARPTKAAPFYFNRPRRTLYVNGPRRQSASLSGASILQACGALGVPCFHICNST